MYFFVSTILDGALPQAKSQWMAWPFTDYGWSAGFWPVVAKIFFMAVLFAAIAFVLRLLFGPKGVLRGEGWETMQEAREREKREQDTAAREAERRKSGPQAEEQEKDADG